MNISKILEIITELDKTLTKYLEKRNAFYTIYLLKKMKYLKS